MSEETAHLGITDQPADAEPPVPTAVSSVPASVRVSLVGIFLIMMIASLYLARSLVLPLVLASLLTLTANPSVRGLARRGVSPVISAVLLVAALAGLAALGGTLLSAPLGDMIAHAPEISAKLRARYDELIRPLTTMLSTASETVVAADPAAVPAKDPPVVGGGTQVDILNWLLGTLADVGSIVVATLLFAPFLIASYESLKLKLVRAFPQMSDKKRSLRVLHDVETRISRYLGTVALINATLGALIGFAMWVLGMPYPLLWGVGAALLNFVPYAGPFTGIAITAAVSITLHDDLIGTILPPIAYATLNSIEGTLVTPLIVGRRLSLSIIAILITIGLMTWVWGVIGTIIAVPILVVVKAFCDELPSLAQLGLFISAETPPIEDEAAPVPAGADVAANSALAARRPDRAG